MTLIIYTGYQLKYNCDRKELYRFRVMGHKCCICRKCCDSHDTENIVCIEPIINSEENSDNEEGYFIDIEHEIDRFRYFTASSDSDNVYTRHDFHDKVDYDGLFNDILNTNNEDSNIFNSYRYRSDEISIIEIYVSVNGVLDKDDFHNFVTTIRDTDMKTITEMNHNPN